MKVAVDVGKLKIGMYVCELDRPWRETPFLFQGFVIRSQDEVDLLRRHCRTVYVLKGEAARNVALQRDRNGRTTYSEVAPPPTYRSLKVEQEIFKINNRPGASPAYADRTSMVEEVAAVRDVFVETRLLVQEIMYDAKLGRSLNLSGAKQSVRSMADSVLRNPDALMCFAWLQRKDEYTALHGLRVSVLALTFGRHLGLPRDQLEALGIGALLHDVGMVRVPDEILKKTTELTPKEHALVQHHVAWGIEALSNSAHIPRAALEVVASHHERHDGSGYPRGLRGEQIGDFGMIGAIVDHYDAITTDRDYRNAVSPHTVLMDMYGWRDTLFRAELVERFIQCLGVYPMGCIVQLNTGEIGIVSAINRSQRLKPHVMLVSRADGSPYPEMPIADIAARRTDDGRACEVECVLEPAAAGFDPVKYLQRAVAV